MNQLIANAAYVFISWNQAGYHRYIEADKSLLHYTLGKVKCSPGQRRFELESRRAIRAIDFALSRGEDLEELNALGQSPLHSATWSGNHHLVDHLLQLGASPLARTQVTSNNPLSIQQGDQTALDIALSLFEVGPEYGNPEVVRLLEDGVR